MAHSCYPPALAQALPAPPRPTPVTQRQPGACTGEKGGEAQAGVRLGKEGHGTRPSTQPVPPGAPRPLLVQPPPHS